MRTSNPALNANVFTFDMPASNTMTPTGTVLKSALLLAMCAAASACVWWHVQASPGMYVPYLIGGMIASLILSLITIWNPAASPYTAGLYAIAEGLLVGGISASFESRYPGIAMQAATGTFGTFAALLLAYSSGLIKPSENFKLGITAATGGIGLLYLASLVLGLFGIHMPYIHESGWIGIGFSLFVVIVAALNLVLDFDFIEEGCHRRAPKYMEWYAAFGLLVTLVWLYIEMLRLLAKLRSKD